MIKRILLPLDPSPFTDCALDFACSIAKIHDAEITGLVILDIPGIMKKIGPLPLGVSYYAKGLEQTKIDTAKIHIHNLLNKFKDKCQKEGVRYRESENQGTPSKLILQESLFYDVLIMGMRTFYHFETSEKAGESLEEILDHSITPIFAVPENYKKINIKKESLNALIAFDGSLQSGRSLQRFAQLLSPGNIEADILVSSDSSEFAEYLLNSAEEYLKTHNIQKIKKIYTKTDIIKKIDSNYIEWADIIVLGAHSKKSIIDFMVGSLARYLIQECKTPIFIGQ